MKILALRQIRELIRDMPNHNQIKEHYLLRNYLNEFNLFIDFEWLLSSGSSLLLTNSCTARTIIPYSVPQ